MRSLVRVFVGLSSIVGGLGTIAAGDLRLLGVAIAIAVVGMIPVSLLLMPGMFFLGALAAALENRVGAVNDGRWFWAGAVLGSLNAMIVQLIWLLACAWVFAGATNGNTAPWAYGLLLVGAAYGVWEWLAMKDVQAGNLYSSVQLSHYGLGLALFWLTLMLAPDAIVVAFVMLMGGQLSAVPRLVNLARLENQLGLLASDDPAGLHPYP